MISVRIGGRVRATLVAAIFQKSMKTQGRITSTVGEIRNRCRTPRTGYSETFKST
jgi:hypothetical protein